MTDKDQKDFDSLNKTIKLCRALIFSKRGLIKKMQLEYNKNKAPARVAGKEYRIKKLQLIGQRSTYMAKLTEDEKYIKRLKYKQTSEVQMEK